MSVTSDVLRTLHRIHQQLSDLQERQARGPKQIKAHTANVARTEQELEQCIANTKAAQIAADQKQLQLKTCENKMLDLKRKLNEASSNREYQALLEQIAADEMAKSVLEDEILEALGNIDELQVAVGEARQKVAKSKDELKRIEQAVADQAAQLQTSIDRLEGELKETEARLPADFRVMYSRVIKSMGSDALAQVENECCGGCFHKLTPNVYNQLCMSQAIFCSSCGRLIYLPEDRSPGRG